jgi:hypothetical protein
LEQCSDRSGLVSLRWKEIVQSPSATEDALGKRGSQEAGWRAGAAIRPRSSMWRRIPRDHGSIALFRPGPDRPLPMESSLFDANVQEEVAPEPLSFELGRDHDGHWIVREKNGLYGGVFASEKAAIQYAKFESADRKSVIRIISDPIELNCSS